VEKELEPLLKNAAPFFNGSQELTLAEALVAPFLIRLYDASEDGELAPKALAEKLDSLPNFAKWAKAVRAKESVTQIYDAKKILENTKVRLAKMAADKK
jgi:glutathione S-transferase